MKKTLPIIVLVLVLIAVLFLFNRHMFVMDSSVKDSSIPVSTSSTSSDQFPVKNPVNPGNPSASVVSIRSLSPSSGAAGTEVTITGSGFTSTGNDVKFGAYTAATDVSSDGSTITFNVPTQFSNCNNKGACTDSIIYVGAGDYDVSVNNAKGSSNSLNFKVTSSSAE